MIKKDEMLSVIIPFMTAEGARYVKSKNTFLIQHGDWTKACFVDFIHRGGHIALNTKFYISNERLNKIFKEITKHTVCPDYLFGGNSMDIAKYISVNFSRSYMEQILIDEKNVSSYFNDWVCDFENIGRPFWMKFSSYCELNLAMNTPPYDSLHPLVLNLWNRVLKGSLLAYLGNINPNELKALLDSYEKTIEHTKVNGLKEDFLSVRTYIENVMDS